MHQPKQHVLESFFAFTQALGIQERVLRWDIPIPEEARTTLRRHLPSGKDYLVICPCASVADRNWDPLRYAQVASHAHARHGLAIVLCGGASELEFTYGRLITEHAQCPVTNLIGMTDLKQLLALLQGARLVLAPDSGPAHLANAVGTPVIGLYAATNPDRARPYNWPGLVVNRYPEAVHSKYGKDLNELPWGVRVRDPAAMQHIGVADVTAVLDNFLQGTTL